jgi:hypothetical protein
MGEERSIISRRRSQSEKDLTAYTVSHIGSLGHRKFSRAAPNFFNIRIEGIPVYCTLKTA